MNEIAQTARELKPSDKKPLEKLQRSKSAAEQVILFALL